MARSHECRRHFSHPNSAAGVVARGAGVLGRGVLFGAPEAAAAKHTLTGKVHAHIASWLRAGGVSS